MKLKERLELIKEEALERKEKVLQNKRDFTLSLSALNAKIQDIDIEIDEIVALLRKLENEEANK